MLTGIWRIVAWDARHTGEAGCTAAEEGRRLWGFRVGWRRCNTGALFMRGLACGSRQAQRSGDRAEFYSGVGVQRDDDSM